jgi:hypothetical protein
MSQEPAAAPTPPPAPGAISVQIAPGGAAPQQQAMTVDAIRAMRRELSNQITSATNRRDNLAGQLRDASVAERPGLEARIGVLDARIVDLEQQLAESGRLLTENPAALVASTREPGPVMWGGFSPDQATAISIVGTIFVLAPLALAAARLMWRRARVPSRVPLPPEASQRLERIEQSVDTMAIEVERVTEGQRFLTKLLTEKKDLPALPAAERPKLHAETIHTPGAGSD